MAAPVTATTELAMGEAFTYQAARDPDRTAILCWDGSITRGELESRANRAARHFGALGVGQSDLGHRVHAIVDVGAAATEDDS
jgi:acyl-CoA synthetase (AMP-forming)/AMP-acid ligase II